MENAKANANGHGTASATLRHPTHLDLELLEVHAPAVGHRLRVEIWLHGAYDLWEKHEGHNPETDAFCRYVVELVDSYRFPDDLEDASYEEGELLFARHVARAALNRRPAFADFGPRLDRLSKVLRETNSAINLLHKELARKEREEN